MSETGTTVGRAQEQVFFFGAGTAEGDPSRKDVLGGKGASLAAMSAAGLPVPPGFTIPITCCRHYHANGGRWPEGLEDAVKAALGRLEAATGRRFGRGSRPLLVSVRSGAARSMPGMMDTLLNCGVHPGLADEGADSGLLWEVYAGFVRQFGLTVAHLPADAFAEADRVAGGWARVRAKAYVAAFEHLSGAPFPRTPWEALVACVNGVFDSWNNERAVLYRNVHGLVHLEGTAVTVQAMFNSQVSGVAFTANPARPDAREIVIESAYGLGESVVSGDVTPDRFVVDADTLAVKEEAIGHKARVMRGLGDTEPLRSAEPDAPSLTREDVRRLAEVSLRVESHFGHPVDLEWGLENGEFALLQARPIRGLDSARVAEAHRREEVERLKAVATGRPLAWVVHNLAETLPAPKPLTWDIVRSFMSGRGGFGLMYRDFGYRPSPRVCEEGFLELIGGRIYADADRASELFWTGMPLRYDVEEILKDPRLIESAPTTFDASHADATFLLRLPGLARGLLRSHRLMKKARRRAAERFETEVLPRFLRYVDEKRAEPLGSRTPAELLNELRDRLERVLGSFGKESLKPGFFGGVAEAELRALLVQLLGEAEGGRLCQVLTSGLDGNVTVEQNVLMDRVARGEASPEEFLNRFGHRGVGEMELANPRFREDSRFRERLRAARPADPDRSPHVLHERNARRRREGTERLAETLAPRGAGCFTGEVRALALEAQRLLPYRESGKHYLMMGFELVRDTLVAWARRVGLGDDVFFLRLDELERFERERTRLVEEIELRKARWASHRRLDLPDVIDSRDVDGLGLPRPRAHARELPGVSLSGGTYEGTARIARELDEATQKAADGVVLVCPSTDPSWTVLFSSIRGLVVERGGVLSHGAITARDFGIPAVACPEATGLIPDGARVRVDGDGGRVHILSGGPHA